MNKQPLVAFQPLLLAVSLALYAAGAAAGDDIVVEGVQMPAWVVHANGTRDALTIGDALHNRDAVRTGANARALLRLADGSTVKLGEMGVLGLDDLSQRKAGLAKQLVTASLDVLVGAFRFTTQALYKYRGERDVKVHLVTMTAGIRGTDIWGKAADDGQTLALLEGEVTVVRDGDAFTMGVPNSVYVNPKQGAPAPVAPLDAEKLREWALETEIVPGTGAARSGGGWKVYTGSADNQADALAAYDKLRAAGYAADIRPVRRAGAMVYRIRISNLPNAAEAGVLAAHLKDAGYSEAPVIAAK